MSELTSSVINLTGFSPESEDPRTVWPDRRCTTASLIVKREKRKKTLSFDRQIQLFQRGTWGRRFHVFTEAPADAIRHVLIMKIARMIWDRKEGMKVQWEKTAFDMSLNSAAAELMTIRSFTVDTVTKRSIHFRMWL